LIPKDDIPPSDAQNSLSIALRYIGYLNPLTIRRRSPKVKAYFALLIVCFFWGTTWIASKVGVSHMPPLQMAAMRQFLGGLLYVIFFLYRGAKWPSRKEWPPILILCLLNFILSNALSTWGVKYVGAGLGSIIGAIFPLWIVIIGFFSRKSFTSRGATLGLLVGFAGICVIFYEHLHQFADPKFSFGIFISVASTWSWAIGTLYTKKHAAHFNPYFALGLQMVISGAVIFAGTHVAGTAIPFAQIPVQAWGAIAYLMIFGSVLTFVAYLYALQNLPTEQASIYAYINPIVAVLLGAIVFGEPLTAFIIAGVIITLAGVWLVNRASRS